jgi:hypothetical protein
MKMQNPNLSMGDILRAWVPFDDSPNVAGPKFRPAIFLGETEINGLTHWVVAYGTTQMHGQKESKNGADFIVRCMEDRGMVLNSDTRFDFNRVFALPATVDFFSHNKRSITLLKTTIPERDLEQAARCMHIAKVDQRLARLGVRL